MKLHLEQNPSLNTVTAYGEGFVEINRQRFEGALILEPEGEVIAWQAESFERLAAEHFAPLAARAPDLVLLGTGARQRFPHPRVWASLAHAGIGVEVMDTRAACRTYNILMGEGRRVLAALLPL
ncbi:MAG TPA: Mth938-like domain-containing protein [Burkholderiaceae bacterium]